MCIILDINVLGEVFTEKKTDYTPVFYAINKKRAKLVIGGYIINEYKCSGKYWRLILELDREGKVRPVDDQMVRGKTEDLVNDGKCKSDDHHIIALAQVGGVRLLCTKDDDLIDDFTNSSLLSPKGNIYKKPEHIPLIDKHCKRYKSS